MQIHATTILTAPGSFDEVEYATLEWVNWFNHRRLLQSIGDIPPAELEMAYYRQQEESAMPA
jgi:putative transposase